MKADHVSVPDVKTARDNFPRFKDGGGSLLRRYLDPALAIEALKKTNKIVLHAHLKSCVSDSFITGVDVNEKIDEVLKLLDKFVNGGWYPLSQG